MNNVNIVNTEATQAIVDAVKASGFKAIDDHGSGVLNLGGVAVHVRAKDGKQTVVALFTKEFSDYYSMNAVSVVNGAVHVTRNAVAGVITDATDDVVADVERNRAGYNWKLIEERPALHPGFLVNVVAAKQ